MFDEFAVRHSADVHLCPGNAASSGQQRKQFPMTVMRAASGQAHGNSIPFGDDVVEGVGQVRKRGAAAANEALERVNACAKRWRQRMMFDVVGSASASAS